MVTSLLNNSVYNNQQKLQQQILTVRAFFSSVKLLAETDYYLCQIQTFSRPTLSKSFSQELGNVQGLILYGHQPVT